MEERKLIEATEKQIKKLTKLYKEGLSGQRFIPIGDLPIEEWLILRSIAGIGSSEIATALGLVPAYFDKTPLRIWKEKVGHIIEVKDTPILRIGRGVEETIVSEYEYLTGRKVQRVKDKMFLHPEIDFLFSDLDGIILPAGGDGYGVLEAKHTLSYVYESWLEKLPTYYFRQGMAELGVINEHPLFKGEKFEYVEFATLILDKRIVEVLRINRDGEFISKQNDEISTWYGEHVIANIPPPESAAEWAKAEPMEDSFIEATPDGYKNYVELKNVQKQIKTLEETEQELKDELIKEIKDYEILIYNGEPIATYKQQSRTTIDSKKLKSEDPETFEKYKKVSTFRQLRPKQLDIIEY